jgi:hypothetical protein
MNPISLVHLHKLLLPSPRSHWSATGPRSKTQLATTQHMQRKHTRHNCWNLKPVRPVSETDQTAYVGLSLTQIGETGQTGLANRSDRFCPETPQNTSETQNTSRAFPPLNKRSHSATETPLLKNPSRQPTWRNWSDRFGKLVRPVLAWTVGKNTTRGKNSKLQAIDRLIRSTDQNLGIVGAPRGLPLARSSVPKTHSIKSNRKSTLKNTFPWKPLKTPKSKPFRTVCWIKISKERGTRSSYVTSNKNPLKKHPQNFPTEISRKDPENNQKGRTGGTQSSLEEPRRIIYTYQSGSYKV